MDILERLDLLERQEGVDGLGGLERLERPDGMDGLDILERQDGMDRLERLDREDRLGGLDRQVLVEVGDLYFPFRMCYWFHLCDVLAVVPEPITQVGVCRDDHAVHIDFFSQGTRRSLVNLP